MQWETKLVHLTLAYLYLPLPRSGGPDCNGPQRNVPPPDSLHTAPHRGRAGQGWCFRLGLTPLVLILPEALRPLAPLAVCCLGRIGKELWRVVAVWREEESRVEGRRLGRPHLSLHPRVASASSSNGDGGLVLRHPFELGDPPAGVSLRICLWQLWIGLDK